MRKNAISYREEALIQFLIVVFIIKLQRNRLMMTKKKVSLEILPRQTISTHESKLVKCVYYFDLENS